MRPLQLETFIGAWRDYEAGQYRVLAGIQHARDQFVHNRLYPTLSELVDLYHVLTAIIKAGDDVKQELPKRIVGLDLAAQRVLYETGPSSREDLDAVNDLIRWAMPKLKDAIEEGATIFNFVEERMALTEVGIVPSYVDEGYLLVPDPERSQLHVVRYEVSIFAGAEQQYRNLKTQTIKSYPLRGVDSSPWHVKQRLMREMNDLPNPATYTFSTELAFPYEQTMLPIAKRKLLGRLCS